LALAEIIEEIGSGKTAKVYRVKLHGFICALKIVKTEGMTDDMKQSLRREVELMSRLNHRYIVTLFGHEEKYLSHFDILLLDSLSFFFLLYFS
jgi:serine/threonine protein kinase